MSQSMYSYPAMTANVGDMAGYTGTTQSLGADIASERTAPSRACQGDLGMSHQDWQAQWNQAMGGSRAGLPSVPASTTPDRGAGKAGRRFVRLRND
ncbi:esat-6 like protein esxQ [Mycobacterium tuberculosis 02_1987]|nr:esat-6 like protein esxQ [Mycobacterium tuberculosis 02_1987]